MDRKDDAFDDAGFFALLADVVRDHGSESGIVTARIHLWDGKPWAASVQFDCTNGKAA